METIGVEGQLDEIRRFIDGAGRRVLLIDGEPGAGKTTLWEAGLADVPALVTRPLEADRNLELCGLRDLLEPLSTEALPAAQQRALRGALYFEAPVERAALSAAALALVRTIERPVVAIDDLQWLDASSAAVIAHVVHRLPDVAIVCTIRSGLPEPLGLERGFEQLLRVTPPALSLDEIRRLVRSRFRSALPRPALEHIWSLSRGNPLYALELARTYDGSGHLPPSLYDLVARRLEALDPGTIDTLYLVAEQHRASAASLVPASLAAALDADILVRDGSFVRFAHPLLAAAARDATPPARRRDVHRALSTTTESPEERIRHLALSDDSADEETAARLEQAARTALERGAVVTAATLLDLAVERTPDTTVAARRVVAAARAHLQSGDTGRARRMLEDVLPSLAPGRDRAEALVALHYTREDDVEAVVDLLTEAVGEAASAPDVAAEAHVLLQNYAAIQADDRRALTHARAALASATKAGDPARTVLAQASVCFAEATVGEETDGLLEQALANEDGLGSPIRPYFGPRCVYARRLLVSDRLEEAERQFRIVLDRTVARGDELYRPPLLYFLGEIAVLTGDWPRALELFDEGYHAAQDLGALQTEIALQTGRAYVRAHLGDVDGATVLARDALERAGEAHDVVGEGRARRALGFLALSLGAHDEAATQLESTALAGSHPARYRTLADFAEARPEALTTLERDAERFGSPWGRAAALRLRGLAQSDATLARSSADDFAALGMPFEAARSRLAEGTILRRQRQRSSARAALEAAAAEFERLGASVWAASTASELSRLGGRVPKALLTAAEESVAQLVAAGLSNKEVASRLVVSAKTVEAHLTRIYEKLGVRSRAELAATFVSSRPKPGTARLPQSP